MMANENGPAKNQLKSSTQRPFAGEFASIARIRTMMACPRMHGRAFMARCLSRNRRLPPPPPPRRLASGAERKPMADGGSVLTNLSPSLLICSCRSPPFVRSPRPWDEEGGSTMKTITRTVVSESSVKNNIGKGSWKEKKEKISFPCPIRHPSSREGLSRGLHGEHWRERELEATQRKLQREQFLRD